VTARDTPLPLDGIRVVDCATLFAGPVIACMLGDYGADVIKVEHPRGDNLRTLGWHKDGVSLWWALVSRNKRCVTLKLSETRGQELMKEILRDADVYIENFRPGTLERWNLGPDVLYGVALGETQEPFLQIGLGRAGTSATRTTIVSGTRWVRIRVRLAGAATVKTVLRDRRGRQLAGAAGALPVLVAPVGGAQLLDEAVQVLVRKLEQEPADRPQHLGQAMRAHPCHRGSPFPRCAR